VQSDGQLPGLRPGKGIVQIASGNSWPWITADGLSFTRRILQLSSITRETWAGAVGRERIKQSLSKPLTSYKRGDILLLLHDYPRAN
jgi:hypothetical protein